MYVSICRGLYLLGRVQRLLRNFNDCWNRHIWDVSGMACRTHVVDSSCRPCTRDVVETLIWVLAWRWDVNMGIWVEMRCDLGGGEMQIYGPWSIWFMDEGKSRILWPEFHRAGPWWRLDAHIETWMALRWCLGGAEMQFGGTGMQVKHHLVAVQRQIYGAGLRWDTIWMERRHESRSLDLGETQISGNG